MKLPSKELAVTIPVELILAKVEAVLVMMLSVDATPVRPVPSPTKLDAVTTPTNSALPTPVTVPPTPDAPNSIPDLAVTTPTESTFVTSS